MLHYRAFSLFIFFLALSLSPCLANAQHPSQFEAGKGNFVIDSDTMEVTGGGNIITFSGRVVTREDFTLCSDELKVTFNDNREILDIVAIGNVRLLQGVKVATAGKAEYDKKARTILFTESPKLSSCGDMVSGEKIRYNMDSGSATVEGGEGVRVRALMTSEKKCTEDVIIEKDFCRGAR